MRTSPVTISDRVAPLPNGWEWVPLGEVAKLATGHTPDRSIPEYWDGGVPWISLTEIRGLDGRVADSTELRVSEAGIRNSSAVVLPAGTVCLSRTASIGFVTVMGRPMATSQDFVNWVCGPKLDPRYLMHALIASRASLRSLSAGSTHKTLYMRVAERFRVLLPPLAEQQRIAAILDKTDELRAKRRAARSLSESLPQAIFAQMFGPHRLQSRPTTTMDSLVTFVGGGTPSRAVERYFNGNICWATSKDMKSPAIHDTLEHVSQEAVENSACKVVGPGTVLVVVKSKILAHSLPVAVAAVPTCFGQDLKALVPRAGVPPMFIAASLRASASWLLGRARGVNTEGLTLEHLRNVPVPSVDLSDQQRFADLASAAAVETRSLNEGCAATDELFASLQNRAFTGQL